jgi:hypothetical protein
MAILTEFSGLLSDTLNEHLRAAEFCINFRKTDDNGTWSDGRGSLGIAAATLLFFIVDIIGNLKGCVEEFEVLNDPIFGLDVKLTTKGIRKLKNDYRNKLFQMGVMDQGALIQDSNKGPFICLDGNIAVHVAAFYDITKSAVKKFLPDYIATQNKVIDRRERAPRSFVDYASKPEAPLSTINENSSPTAVISIITVAPPKGKI